jgi:hypothetical protein
LWAFQTAPPSKPHFLAPSERGEVRPAWTDNRTAAPTPRPPASIRQSFRNCRRSRGVRCEALQPARAGRSRWLRDEQLSRPHGIVRWHLPPKRIGAVSNLQNHDRSADGSGGGGRRAIDSGSGLRTRKRGRSSFVRFGGGGGPGVRIHQKRVRRNRKVAKHFNPRFGDFPAGSIRLSVPARSYFE